MSTGLVQQSTSLMQCLQVLCSTQAAENTNLSLQVKYSATAVEQEASDALAPLQKPRDFVRDPIMLEFLGLPSVGRLLEAELERALLDNLQAFLLELGRGFAFVARQFRISTESKDFFVDLVFYNYLVKCFVLFDLNLAN